MTPTDGIAPRWGGPAEQYMDEDSAYDSGVKPKESEVSLVAMATSVAQLFEANPLIIQPPDTATIQVLDWEADEKDDGSVTLMMVVGIEGSFAMPETVIYEFAKGSESWFQIENLADSFKKHLSSVLKERTV